MRKLLLIFGLLLFAVGVEGQAIIRANPQARAQVSGGCGTGTSDYGITDHTGNLTSYFYASNIYYTPITIVNCGQVTSIHSYVTTASSANSYVALYTDNGGEPGTMILESNLTATSGGVYNEWTFPSALNVTSSTTYWVAYRLSLNNYFWITGAGTQTLRYEVGTTFPATATSLGFVTDAYIPVYVTVNHEL